MRILIKKYKFLVDHSTKIRKKTRVPDFTMSIQHDVGHSNQSN